MSKKPTVLVVEDEQGFREVYSDAFEHAGLTVITAEDGEEAWDIMLNQEVDVVLLDLIIPKMDGLLLLKLMKTEEAISDIPVVVASVLGDDAAVQQAMMLGAQKYIHKGTVSIPEIVRMIKDIAVESQASSLALESEN